MTRKLLGVNGKKINAIPFLSQQVKAYLADPSSFAAVAAPVAAAETAAAPAAAKEEAKEESEESDDDMGFGLFD